MHRRSFLHSVAASAIVASSVRAAQQTRRVRVGVIGTAHSHAAGKLQAMLEMPELFEIVGIVEPDADRRVALSKQLPYSGLPFVSEQELFAISGLKSVVVETTVRDLTKTGRRVVDAGFSLHLEKPAGESLPEFRKLLDVAKAKSLHVQMGYMLRYNPGMVRAREIVAQGVLGDVFEVDSSFGKLVGLQERRELAEFRGGAMYELGCHLIDAITTIFGMPQQVSAFNRSSGAEPTELADNQMAILQYARSIAVVRTAVVDPNGSGRRRLAIYGSNGMLELQPIEANAPRLTLNNAAGGYAAGVTQIELQKSPGRYHDQMRDFAMTVRGDHSARWSYNHDLETHRVILQACGYDVKS